MTVVQPALDLTDPNGWTPPPTTRWCLVGEPGRGERALYVLTEHGTADDPPCPLEEPDRGNYLSKDPADHPPAWLSPFGIGTTPGFTDGILGFVEYLVGIPDTLSPAQRAAARRR